MIDGMAGRMRLRSVTLGLLAGWFLAGAAVAAEGPAATAAAPKAPTAKPRLGMNLAGPADWDTELPFVDVFREARTWISQQKGQPWGKGPDLALDKHGWVTKLDKDCSAETLMCTISGGHYPTGEYTVLYEGQGKLTFNNAAVVSEAAGKIVIKVDPAKGSFFLRLMETSPDNYVRNIRVIMPGFADTYKAEPFHPAFLKRWQGVAALRFMDWMHTNGSKVRTWADRPTPQDATFSAKGIALEVMIDLCNRQKADGWFCMPHLADDEYVRNFTKLVKDKLDPKLRAYIEYSNEVWNSQFPQTRHSWDKGKELGLGPKERPWEGGGMYYARRSVEIFRIWEEAFGGRDRLVRVIAWQSGNTFWMRNIVLNYQDAWKQTDALAIAPYIACCVPPKGKDLSADVVENWTVDQALDYMENKSLPVSVRMMQDTKKVADEFGLRMVAYEGGQHMVGVTGGENNEKMTALFHAANAHPRMGGIYDKYFAAWTDAGGDLFAYFSSVGQWSKWGSWGVIQYYDDGPAKSPKLQALLRWAKARGQAVGEGK
jgi:hypothetical protein